MCRDSSADFIFPRSSWWIVVVLRSYITVDYQSACLTEFDPSPTGLRKIRGGHLHKPQSNVKYMGSYRDMIFKIKFRRSLIWWYVLWLPNTGWTVALGEFQPASKRDIMGSAAQVQILCWQYVSRRRQKPCHLEPRWNFPYELLGLVPPINRISGAIL